MADPLARNLICGVGFLVQHLPAPIQLGFQFVNGLIELIALLLHLLQAGAGDAIGFLELRGLAVADVVHIQKLADFLQTKAKAFAA